MLTAKHAYKQLEMITPLKICSFSHKSTTQKALPLVIITKLTSQMQFIFPFLCRENVLISSRCSRLITKPTCTPVEQGLFIQCAHILKLEAILR